MSELSIKSELSSKPGSYILQLSLEQPAEIAIGRVGPGGPALGSFVFPAGNYLYLGSAQGRGGVRARLGRHLRPVDRPRWHIDWFRQKAVVMDYFFVMSEKPWECVWSQILAEQPQARILVPGFGSSDCHRGCLAHLVYWEGEFNFKDIQALIMG